MINVSAAEFNPRYQGMKMQFWTEFPIPIAATNLGFFIWPASRMQVKCYINMTTEHKILGKAKVTNRHKRSSVCLSKMLIVTFYLDS